MEVIVTVIPPETVIMTEETPRMTAQATTTTVLVMVTHHLVTVVPPLKEMGTAHQEAEVLAMVAVVTRLVAKATMEASAILQVIRRQETKALMAITN